MADREKAATQYERNEKEFSDTATYFLREIHPI